MTTLPRTPTTAAGRAWLATPAGQIVTGMRDAILAIEDEAEARASLDVPLQRAVLKFYADQMPAYAAAAGLNREQYAAVMVDVKRARAEYAALSLEEPPT